MAKEAHHHNNSHIPVLLDAVLAYLQPSQGETYLDLTAGYGGHASAVLSNLGDDMSKMTLVDRDQSAVTTLQSRFKTARIIHQDFATAAEDLAGRKQQFDMILIDLGVSSPHLDNAERGFSFQHDGPLDMRMDPRQDVSAETIVNTYSEAELISILKQYGDELRAKKVAQAIVANRPLGSTADLAQVIETILGRTGKIHPATRTFQAIRIAVNDELGQIRRVLRSLPELLLPGGRVVIISFHSLEDRLVKQYLADEMAKGYEAQLKVLTKKPIAGSKEELVFNPRARSAKLRAAVKIKR